MSRKSLIADAGQLIALYEALRASKPHEFRYHRLLQQYVVAFAQARGEPEWFLHIDSRKYANWGRHMALLVLKSKDKWFATLQMNARAREELVKAVEGRDPGLLVNDTIWGDQLIGILNMSLWHESDNGWWRVPDPKNGAVVLNAYAALEYKSEKGWAEYARKHGLSRPDPATATRISEEAWEEYLRQPEEERRELGPSVIVSSHPTHRTLYPARAAEWSAALMERILAAASKTDLQVWPEIIPLSVLRHRGRLTATQAVARYLCEDPNGPQLSPYVAAKAMGARDWRDVRAALRGAARNHSSGDTILARKPSGEQGRHDRNTQNVRR